MLEQFLIYMCLKKKKKKVVWVLSRTVFKVNVCLGY